MTQASNKSLFEAAKMYGHDRKRLAEKSGWTTKDIGCFIYSLHMKAVLDTNETDFLENFEMGICSDKWSK